MKADASAQSFGEPFTENSTNKSPLPIRSPSTPDFPWQSQFLTTCPGKKHSSPGTPICPVFGLVSRIYPNIDKLRYFTS